MVVSSSPATVWNDGGGFIEAPVGLGERGLARNGLWDEMVAIAVDVEVPPFEYCGGCTQVHRICQNYYALRTHRFGETEASTECFLQQGILREFLWDSDLTVQNLPSDGPASVRRGYTMGTPGNVVR